MHHFLKLLQPLDTNQRVPSVVRLSESSVCLRTDTDACMPKRMNCLGVKKVEKGSGHRGSKYAKCPPGQAFSATFFKLPKLPLATRRSSRGPLLRPRQA